MADWKTQLSYNYNPSYAYAYGLTYPPAPEQTHGNVSGWGESSLTDLSNYNAGVNQAYYTAAARTQDETPPQSPDEHPFNGHYQHPGPVYFGGTQGNRLLLTGQSRAPYDVREHEPRRAGSDTASDDSETQASPSPDSWSSGSSREGSLPLADPAMWVRKDLDEEADPAMWVRKDLDEEADPAMWVKKDLDNEADPAMWAKKELDSEANSRSPDATREVSSTLKDSPTFAVTGNENIDTSTSSPQQTPMNTPKNPSTTANPKGKVRVAFTESQMDVLTQRFSVQRYLTPAEMKQLAEVTGLSYKQVKTWFQNRRMKLRRHQKDKSWVSERYNANKCSPVGGPIFPSHIQPYPGDARPPLNQHMAFYLAAMGSAPGSAGYPPWSGTPQSALPNSPQTPGWPVPPVVNHYEYAPPLFNPVSVNTPSQDTSFDKDDEQINRSPLATIPEHNANQ